MKFTQKYISVSIIVLSLLLFSACAEQYTQPIAYPNDITFNDLALPITDEDGFAYKISDAPFEVNARNSGTVTFNVNKKTDGSYSGFALSNRNIRHFPWELSPTIDEDAYNALTEEEIQTAINSTAFSVYTGGDLNSSENFLVGNTDDDNAFFTLSSPSIISHVLVANTTYNYFLARYGSVYPSGTTDDVTGEDLFDADPVQNINIDNTDLSLYGIFTLPAPDGSLVTTLTKSKRAGRVAAGEAAGIAARDAFLLENPGSTDQEQFAAYDEAYDEAFNAYTAGEVKLTIEGFLNDASVGTEEVYLSVLQGSHPDDSNYLIFQDDWRNVDLTSFGEVDKVLFKMTSSYVNTDGSMVYPPTFCLDGIVLQ